MKNNEVSDAHITKDKTLRQAIFAWIIYLNDKGNSPHTVKAFSADLRLLASFLPPDRKMSDITTLDLNQFLDWLQKGRGVSCSPKSLARRITSVKAFFRWLHEHGVLAVDPSSLVLQRSVISPLPTILTPDEITKILDAAQSFKAIEKPDPRHITLISLLLHSGIKKSECLALKLNHIDFNTLQGPTLFIRYTNPQYRYKERKIVLPFEWVELFESYNHQYKLNDQLFPWSQRRLEYLLEDLSRKAGLDKHLSFDMCRWTCAVTDWQAGMEHEKIRQKLGVSKIQWREVRLKLDNLTSSV